MSRIGYWIYPGNELSDIPLLISNNQFDVLKPEYLTVNTKGKVVIRTVKKDGLNGYSVKNAENIKAHSKEQFITVSSDADNMKMLLKNSKKRIKAIQSMLNLVQSTGFSGIELDWEGVAQWTTKTYSQFLSFVTQLGNLLHSIEKKLLLCVPPISNSIEQSYYCLKYEDLDSRPIDEIVIMCYDYMYDYGGSSPVAPTDWVNNILKWAKSKITNISRITAGLNVYGYHANVGKYNIAIDFYNKSKQYPSFSTAKQNSSNEMSWTENGIFYCYVNQQGLNAKVQNAIQQEIPSISVWHLGGGNCIYRE